MSLCKSSLKSAIQVQLTGYFHFYAPNFKKVPPTSKKLRGHIGLGLSICMSVHYACIQSRTIFQTGILAIRDIVNKISGWLLELESWYLAYSLCSRFNIIWLSFDKILWIFDWIMSLFPTLAFCTVKHPVNKIFGELLELGSWYLWYSLGTWCIWND